MEFEFDLTFLGSDHNGISIWNGDFPSKLSYEDSVKFGTVTDTMGKLSCEAQSLGRPVTAAHLLRGTNHTLYIVCHHDEKLVKGIIKVGYKKLFIHNLHHEYEVMSPLCVLDFYVHEKYQRRGIGKILFEFMLKCQRTEPKTIAYDAPSLKLRSFLNKYYGLNQYTPQNCNFVVYHDYFSTTESYHYQAPAEIIIPRTPNTEVTDSDPKPVDSEELINGKQSTEFKDEEKEQSQNVTLQLFDAASHEKDLEWIQKQMERTKLEISKSDDKIHKHFLNDFKRTKSSFIG